MREKEGMIQRAREGARKGEKRWEDMRSTEVTSFFPASGTARGPG